MRPRVLSPIFGSLAILLGAWLAYWSISTFTGFTILLTKATQRLLLAITFSSAMVVVASGVLLIVRTLKPPPPQPVAAGNWFHRHLNLSLLIAGLATFPLMLGAASLLAHTYEDASIQLMLALAYAVSLAVLLPVGSWFLRQKRRHQHFLWLVTLPLGWLLLMFVDTRPRP